MLSAYHEASEERGPGSIKRMRVMVVDHVAEKKLHMFNDTSNELIQRLHALHVSICSKSVHICITVSLSNDCCFVGICVWNLSNHEFLQMV